MKKEKEDKRQRDLARKAKIVKPLSPYFQEPNIPGKMRNERKLLSDYPDTAATLFHMDEEPLEAYLWSRWFGTYTLNDAHRVGKSIIYEEINNIFESFKAASANPRRGILMCPSSVHSGDGEVSEGQAGDDEAEKVRRAYRSEK